MAFDPARGQDTVSPPRTAITPRAILLGLLLVPPNCYWCLQVEGIWHSGHPSALSLFWNVIFTILVLITANLVVKRFRPAWALSQGEFIVIYILLYMATALAGHDSLQLQIPSLAMPWYFANDSNKYADFLNPYLPEWLTVQHKEIVENFIEGHSSLFAEEQWKAWALPIFWWTMFITALGLVMICTCVFLRRQWTENEKLSYPIIQLPMAMTEDGGKVSFFANKGFWIAFLAVAALNTINALNAFIPSIPPIKVRHNFHVYNTLFTTFPWNQMGNFWVPLYPFLIALGFFLPLDLSFSIWFFFLFQKAQNILAAVANVPNMPGLPYAPEQSAGALAVICVYTFWLARAHLSGVLKTLLQHPDRLDDSEEPVRYRTALLGLIVGLAFIYWFCHKAGMTPGVILGFFGIYAIISISVTRIRAELGPPAHEMVGLNSMKLLIAAQGTVSLGPRNLAMYPLFYWFTGRGYRTQIMPPMMEGFKMAERSGISARGLGWIVLLGLWFGAICVYVIGVHLSYANSSSFNGMTMHNHGQLNEAKSWIEGLNRYDRTTNWPRLTFLGGAMVFTAFLMFMRLQFLKWPFHPAGYALSMTFGVDYFWTCVLLAWLIKSLVLKWGGYGLYRKCLPVCYGVLLGEYVVGALLSVLSLFYGRPIYDFSPG